MAVSNPTVRLRQLYILLAILNLVTIGGGVFLTHTSESHFKASVQSSERWVTRAAEYSQLLSLSRAVNTPGNDVFLTGDVATESRRAALASRQFEASLATVRRSLADDTSVTSSPITSPMSPDSSG